MRHKNYIYLRRKIIRLIRRRKERKIDIRRRLIRRKEKEKQLNFARD